MASSYPAYDSRQPNPHPPAQGYMRRDVSSSDSDLSETNDVRPLNPTNYSKTDVRVDMRQISRTPSPTPSEAAELNRTQLIDYKAMMQKSFWMRREWLWYYVIGLVVLVLTILITVFHQQIVNKLQPAANWMHNLPAGFLIPIAILFVISFPPLFGHEIVAILCGVVWGLGPGFAIVAVGTFVGEIGNFYAFRYCCSARGDKLERTNIRYACLARVVREGGFKVALIARFSAIPGHFTTAVFSTCGMNIWLFMAAAFFSLPKQFVTVYLGVALEQSDDGKSNKLDNILKYVVIVVTGIVTFLAMYYINRLMNGVKPAVIYNRRKARQAKLPPAGASSGPYGDSNVFKPATSGAFNPNASDSDMPLTANFNESSYQQWDSNGRAVGYAPDPMLYAPQPQRPRVPQSASRAGSNAPTPVMSEYNGSRGPPSRQNTSGSAASWDVQTHAGGADAYQMSRASPYTDPYSNSTRVPPPQIQQMPYSQSPPPIQSVAPNSATAPVTPRIPPPEQTPTQMQFASYRPPAGLPPGAAQPYQPHSPHSPLPNPYSRGQESSDDPYVAYTSGR